MNLQTFQTLFYEITFALRKDVSGDKTIKAVCIFENSQLNNAFKGKRLKPQKEMFLINEDKNKAFDLFLIVIKNFFKLARLRPRPGHFHCSPLFSVEKIKVFGS